MSLLHFHASAEHGHGHGTWLERRDPRVKLISALVAALWVGLLPPAHVALLGPFALGLALLGALGQLSPVHLLWRASAALPFIVVPALLRLELVALLPLGARGYCAAMVVALLVGLTPFSELLAAASALRVPDLLVQTVALIYRYMLLLRARAAAVAASARARGFGPRSPRRMAAVGAMLGGLLLGGLDRSERVHRSMLARGYTGRFPSLRRPRMALGDWASLAAVLLGAVLSLGGLS